MPHFVANLRYSLAKREIRPWTLSAVLKSSDTLVTKGNSYCFLSTGIPTENWHDRVFMSMGFMIVWLLLILGSLSSCSGTASEAVTSCACSTWKARWVILTVRSPPGASPTATSTYADSPVSSAGLTTTRTASCSCTSVTWGSKVHFLEAFSSALALTPWTCQSTASQAPPCGHLSADAIRHTSKPLAQQILRWCANFLQTFSVRIIT